MAESAWPRLARTLEKVADKKRFVVAAYVVAFLPWVVLEGGSASNWESLATDKWFVVASYIVAFLPWVVYGVIDHVDSQWRNIEDLRWRTSAAVLLCRLSILHLLVYTAVQAADEQWNEAMAAVVVLVAAWLPWFRLKRQRWLLSSSGALADRLHSLPTFGGYSFWDDFRSGSHDAHRKDSWRPGNSNKFFDNDNPGEGVTDVGLLAYLLDYDQYKLTYWTLYTEIFSLQRQDFLNADNPHTQALYSKENYDLAMDLVMFRLRILVANDPPKLYNIYRTRLRRLTQDALCFRHFRLVLDFLWYYLLFFLVSIPFLIFYQSKPAKAAENGFTRSLWLYENLTGQGWLSKKRGKLAQVLHLGLVVHVGMVAVQGFTPEKLDWVNVLAGPGYQEAYQTGDLRRPSYGHLRTPGLLLEEWFPKGELKWFQKDDFDEVFAKLPTERSSLKENKHLRWENIMFMVCSTIELHVFMEALFKVAQIAAVSWEAQASSVVDTVWKYITGAFAMNYCTPEESSATVRRQKKLHVAVEELPEQYKTDLKGALIGGPDAERNWTEIIVHCGNIVDVVTNALHREAPQRRVQTLMPYYLRDKYWRTQLLETRTALIGTLMRVLPSYGHFMDANASGPTSAVASASAPSSGAVRTESSGAPSAITIG